MIRRLCPLLTTGILLLCSLQASAQNGQPRMEVRAEILPALQVESRSWAIRLDSDLLYGMPFISPQSEHALQLSFAGPPGQFLSLSFPETIELRGRQGVIHLRELELLMGGNPDPTTMQDLPIDMCTRLSIPDEGTLYIRVGGMLNLSGYLMEGLYRGTLTVHSVCMEE